MSPYPQINFKESKLTSWLLSFFGEKITTNSENLEEKKDL